MELKTFSMPGFYDVKVKAEDEHDASEVRL